MHFFHTSHLIFYDNILWLKKLIEERLLTESLMSYSIEEITEPKTLNRVSEF